MKLAIDQSILWRERRPVGRQVLQPLQVRRAPVGALPKHEPAARQELEDVVPRFEDLALESFPAPHDIADPFVRLTRDAYRHELAGPIEPR